MVLETLVPIQRYVTVLILLVASFIWLFLRKKKGEEGLGKLKINRAYTILVLLLLPYLVATFSYFSEEIASIGKSFLSFLIFFAMFIVLFKLHRKASEERIKDLRDLLKESRKNPIRYEFARKIVAPELKILLAKEEEIAKKQRSLSSKTFAQEKLSKSRESRVDSKFERMEKLKKEVIDNIAELEKKKKDTENEIVEKRKDIQKEIDALKTQSNERDRRESEVAKKERELTDKLQAQKEKKVQLDAEIKRHNEESGRQREEMLAKLKGEEMRRIKQREQELDILEAEVLSMRKDVQRREKNLNPRWNMLEDKEREAENRLTKIRMRESEIREGLDNLKILKKDFAKEQRALLDAKDDFEDFKASVEAKERKSERIREIFTGKNEKMKQRTVELDQLVIELDKRQKNLDALERDIAKKSKNITTMQIKLDKKVSEAALEEGKKKTEDDIGEFISEKSFNGKKIKITRRKLK